MYRCWLVTLGSDLWNTNRHSGCQSRAILLCCYENEGGN